MGAKKQVISTDSKLDYLEQLSDQHKIQFNLTRAPGIWIASASFPDGRQYSAQSPADQSALLNDLIASIDRALTSQHSVDDKVSTSHPLPTSTRVAS